MLASMHHLQYWIWQLGCLLALCLIRPFPAVALAVLPRALCTIRPLSRRMMRSALTNSSRWWVTRMMVLPRCCNSSRICMMSARPCGSSMAVGSSSTRISGDSWQACRRWRRAAVGLRSFAWDRLLVVRSCRLRQVTWRCAYRYHHAQWRGFPDRRQHHPR